MSHGPGNDETTDELSTDDSEQGPPSLADGEPDNQPESQSPPD